MNERAAIEQGIDNLNEGGRITQIMIGGQMLPVAIVPTAYMEYPPQMNDEIIRLLELRLAEIDTELTALGVTGVEDYPDTRAAATGKPKRRK